MKILKGLALSLLSFLLFLSLSIFGLAFMLNNTLLNPDFVTSELDRLDISSLAEEFISEPAPGEESSDKMMVALVDTTTKLEPLLKEQVSAATYSIYDYLLGKKQRPELAQTLKNTILSSDFVTSLVNELDIASLVGEYIRPRLTENIPTDMGYLVKNIDKHLDDVLTELEPWIKEQVATAADPIVDYLLGESQSFRIVISLEPVKKILGDKLWADLLESPPPELTLIPQAMWEPYFNQFYGEFVKEIPATFELDQSLLGTKIPTQIAEALAGAEKGLEQARQYVGYFQLGYKVLIGFMVLLILGIILINRQVKGTTRSLGTIFLTYGAFEYAGIVIGKYFMRTQLTLPALPAPLQTWLPQFLDNLLAPLGMFSLGLLIGGVVLIIVSFVYKPR